jgi:hypothetical protein
MVIILGDFGSLSQRRHVQVELQPAAARTLAGDDAAAFGYPKFRCHVKGASAGCILFAIACEEPFRLSFHGS